MANEAENEAVQSEEVNSMARQLAETGAITYDQAQVYVLREFLGCGRQEAGVVLPNKSLNTIDNLYTSARKNVQQSRKLAALVKVYEEETPDW